MSRRRSTPSTRRSGAIPPTTSTASPASARRPRPSSSTRTAGSTASSPTSRSRRPSCGPRWPSTRRRVRRNADVMILRRDAPFELDLDGLHWGPPDVAEVKRALRLPRVPLAVRPPQRGARQPGRRAGDAVAGRSWRPRSSTPRPRPTALALLAGLDVLDLAAAWSGAEGRSALLGLAVVVEPEAAEVAWIPAEHLADEAVRSALTGGHRLRAHNAKAVMRSLLDLGIDVKALELDTAIARLPAGPGREPLRPRRAPGPVHARHARHRRTAPEGQLDLGGSGRRRGEAARPGGRSPSTGSPPPWSRPSTPRACASSTTRSRARSCGCWPGWSTSASVSTSRSCAASTSG